MVVKFYNRGTRGRKMGDLRLSKLVDVLMNRSLEVKEGQTVIIRAEELARPLINEFYKAAIKKGANAYMHLIIPEQKKTFIESATEAQIQAECEFYHEIYKKCDAILCIEAPYNMKYMTSVDPEKTMKYNKAMNSIVRTITDKKWVISNYPTHAFAQEAEMSLEEYEDFLYDAVLVDYEKMDKDMDKITELFDKADEIRIKGKETDLTFSIKGRLGTKCSGQNNIPDGEVFYAPLETSVNGHIYYEFPPMRYGVQVDGVRLEFKDGKIVSAKADRNEDFLNKMLDTDEGSRYIGEFGIGLNYGIKKFIKNILFDEKIGGTIHLAAGYACDIHGEGNKSALHWDMIKELRDCGEIYADGRLVQKNGVFIFE